MPGAATGKTAMHAAVLAWFACGGLAVAALPTTPVTAHTGAVPPALATPAAGPVAAVDAATLAACDGPAFATTLHASPAAGAESTGASAASGHGGPAPDARAYWLDGRLLAWPGAPGATNGAAPATGPAGDAPAPAPARHRPHHSATGQLLARPGQPVTGADGAIELAPHAAPLPPALAERFGFIGAGPVLALPPTGVARLPELLRGQLLLAREDASGGVLDATSLQVPGALDDLYASADAIDDLGAQPGDDATGFRLWAPTARAVALCLYPDGAAGASALVTMQRDD